MSWFVGLLVGSLVACLLAWLVGQLVGLGWVGFGLGLGWFYFAAGLATAQGLPPFRAPWELAAARKLAAGPPEVLQGFVASGLVVAFSAFLTSFSSFKKRGGGGRGGEGRGRGGKGGERGGEKIVKGEFKELLFLLFFPTATQQTENKIQNNKQTK